MELKTLLVEEPDLRPIVEAINYQQQLADAGLRTGLYLHRTHALAAGKYVDNHRSPALPAAAVPCEACSAGQSHVATSQQASTLQIKLGPVTCLPATDDSADSIAAAKLEAQTNDLSCNEPGTACFPAISVIAVLAEALFVQHDPSTSSNTSSSSSSGYSTEEQQQHVVYIPRAAALLHTRATTAEPAAAAGISQHITAAHQQHAACMCNNSSGTCCCAMRPVKRRRAGDRFLQQQRQQQQMDYSSPNGSSSSIISSDSSNSTVFRMPSGLQPMTDPHLLLLVCESFADRTAMGKHKQQQQQQLEHILQQQQQYNLQEGSATSDPLDAGQLLQQQGMGHANGSSATAAAAVPLPGSRMLDCSLHAGVMFGVLRNSQAAADAITTTAAAAAADDDTDTVQQQQQRVPGCGPVCPVMWAAVPLTTAALASPAGTGIAVDAAAAAAAKQQSAVDHCQPGQHSVVTLKPGFVSATAAAGNSSSVNHTLQGLRQQQQTASFRMELRSAATAAVPQSHPHCAFRWGHLHLPLLLKHQQRSVPDSTTSHPIHKQLTDRPLQQQQPPMHLDFIYGLKSQTNGSTSLRSYMNDFSIPDKIAQRLAAAAAAGVGSSTRSRRGQPKVLRLDLADMSCPLCFERVSRFRSVQALRVHFDCCHQQFECKVKDSNSLEVWVRQDKSRLSNAEDNIIQQPYYWSKKQRTADWWQQQGLRTDRDLNPVWAETAAAEALAAAQQRAKDRIRAQLRQMWQQQQQKQRQKGAAVSSGQDSVLQQASSQDYDSNTDAAAAAAEDGGVQRQMRRRVQHQRKKSGLSDSAAAAGGGARSVSGVSNEDQGHDDDDVDAGLQSSRPQQGPVSAVAAAVAGTSRALHNSLQQQRQQEQQLVQRFVGVMYHCHSVAPLTAADLAAGSSADDEIDYDNYRVQQLRAWHAEGKTTISERHFMLAWNRFLQYPSLPGPTATDLSPETIYNWAVYAAPRCSLNPDLERCYITHLVTLHKFGSLGHQDLARCLKELRSCHDAGVQGQGFLSNRELALEGADGSRYDLDLVDQDDEQQQQQRRRRKRLKSRSRSTSVSAAAASGDLQQMIKQQQRRQQQQKAEGPGQQDVALEASPGCDASPMDTDHLPQQEQRQQQQETEEQQQQEIEEQQQQPQQQQEVEEQQQRQEEELRQQDIAMEPSPSCGALAMDMDSLPQQEQQQQQETKEQQQQEVQEQQQQEAREQQAAACTTLTAIRDPLLYFPQQPASGTAADEPLMSNSHAADMSEAVAADGLLGSVESGEATPAPTVAAEPDEAANSCSIETAAHATSSPSIQPTVVLGPAVSLQDTVAAAPSAAAAAQGHRSRSPSPSMSGPATLGNNGFFLNALVKQLVPEGTHSSLSRSVSPAPVTLLPAPAGRGPAGVPAAAGPSRLAAAGQPLIQLANPPVAAAPAASAASRPAAVAAAHTPSPLPAAAAAASDRRPASLSAELPPAKRRITPLLKSAKVLHVQRQSAAAAGPAHSIADQQSAAQVNNRARQSQLLEAIKTEDESQSVKAGSADAATTTTAADHCSDGDGGVLWRGYLMKRSRKLCRIEGWAVQHISSSSHPSAATGGASGSAGVGAGSSVEKGRSLQGSLSISALPAVIRADWRVRVKDAVHAYRHCSSKRRRLFWITQVEAPSVPAVSAAAAAANSTVAVAGSETTSSPGNLDWQGQLDEFVDDLISKGRCGVAKITNKVSLASDEPAAKEQSHQYFLYMVPAGEEVCRQFGVRRMLQDGGCAGGGSEDGWGLLGVLVRNRSTQHHTR